jgi:hypothetical protein
VERYLLLVVVDPKLASGIYLRPDAVVYLLKVVTSASHLNSVTLRLSRGGSDNLNHLLPV